MKISYSCKQSIAFIILGIISAVVWIVKGPEEAFGVIQLYFILHFLYSTVKIGLMEEEHERIPALVKRNEMLENYIRQLEKKLEDSQNSNIDF